MRPNPQPPGRFRLEAKGETTGGVFALLTLAAVALAAMVLTVTMGAIAVILALAVAAAALVIRVVSLPWSWRHRIPPATPWPGETFEATVVNPTASSDEGDLLRMGSDKG